MTQRVNKFFFSGIFCQLMEPTNFIQYKFSRNFIDLKQKTNNNYNLFYLFYRYFNLSIDKIKNSRCPFAHTYFTHTFAQYFTIFMIKNFPL